MVPVLPLSLSVYLFSSLLFLFSSSHFHSAPSPNRNILPQHGCPLSGCSERKTAIQCSIMILYFSAILYRYTGVKYRNIYLFNRMIRSLLSPTIWVLSELVNTISPSRQGTKASCVTCSVYCMLVGTKLTSAG